jgi:protocatechuate 3,4-dioxygenase beta subunit
LSTAARCRAKEGVSTDHPVSVEEGAMANEPQRYPHNDVTRRRTLLGLSACATTVLVPSATLAQAARCVLTQDAGEGPFYFDPKLLRSDVTDGAVGAPLQVAIRVTRTGDCAPLAEARLDLWQADGLGLYSGYANQRGVGERVDVVDRTYLRGTQIADADGWVRFKTIFPSWYGGRTPHIHFKVLLGGREVVASQIFFPDEVAAEVFRNWDPYRRYVDRRTVFNHNDPIPGSVLCEVQENRPTGLSATVTVAVDPRA